MSVVIPITPDVPHFDFQVELDGVTYTLELRWNERDAAWYLSLLTAEEDPLVMGRKVVLDVPLWSRFKDPRVPRGLLVAVDTSQKGIDAGYDDLGRRVQLVYTPTAEIAGL